MPTFAANRSSSAILKNVLHEERSAVTVPLRPVNVTGDGLYGSILDKSNSSNLQTNLPATAKECRSNTSDIQDHTFDSTGKESTQTLLNPTANS